MTRAEKARRRDEIKERYRNGATAEELAEQYGLTKGYVWQIVDIKRTNKISAIREDVGEIVQKLRNGETQTEIARSYGVDRSAVHKVLAENGFAFRPQKNSEEEVRRKVKEKTDGALEYVSGYSNKTNPIVVRCAICAKQYTMTFHHITTHFTGCPTCRELKAQEEKSRKRLEIHAREFRRKLKTAASKADKAKQLQVNFCEACGAVTYRPKFCSNQCAQKVHDAQKCARRRLKIKGAFVDRGISVQALFVRDGGVCHICGQQCDYEDYIVKGNTFIAGNQYPSVDHIVPLTLGGTHSWDNVKLAHRRCNSLKGGRQ